MARNQSASSMLGRRPARNVRHISDDRIDFSDIPESTDTELAKARRVGRPSTGRAKQLIAIRIDPEVLSKLRKLAAKKRRPYQTVLHEILESAVNKAA